MVVLELAITLSIGLSPTPTETGAIDQVVDSPWEGMRHREIGNAQAWYYPSDRLLVLWECYLSDFARLQEPNGDEAVATVWTGFEGVLLDRFPQAQRIAMPSWEDLYRRPAWQQFLAGQGYAPFTPGCFIKAVMPGPQWRIPGNWSPSMVTNDLCGIPVTPVLH